MTNRIDAAPVRAHIDMLAAAGASHHGIAAAAHTGAHQITSIHNGTQPTVTACNARRILAVTVGQALNDYYLRLDSTGTVRQIRALMAIGHPVTDIRTAAEPEIDRSTMTQLVNGTLPRVRARTAAGVDVAYRRLSETWGTSAKSRLRAERAGWAPPAAWDGKDLTNPDEFPDWTGACGTVAGFNRHVKHDIPACGRCTAAEEVLRGKKLGRAA